ncbi:M56 family metallopeptidase [Kutzneria buriramensis]|uniref:Peptidase M48-like protein n=1 Tax=Kutzneria buriramensis TaxID=1045776 RepID=A0A3E0GVK1_9PSEU|nr:M56 family metallopeptidase [Kutzneria buriramensis]REH27686.1 peptidase M48-like protein [Kutzneria buriramensis]
MTAPVLAAFAVMLLFAAVAPRLGQRLTPAIATCVLTAGSVIVAGSTGFVLAVLALTWLGQAPLVAWLADWSPSELDANTPVPEFVAAGALILLSAAGLRLLIRAIRRGRALVAVRRAHRGSSAVIVVDSDCPDAFATPAPHGRIVVTSALLAALSPEEQRVVLAHERAHLRHWHAWLVVVADLAEASNPLLRPTVAVIRHAVERWADEDAARRIGDRHLVARTVARVALLRHDTADSPLAPAATGGQVPQRVRALLSPPPDRRLWLVAVIVGLLTCSFVATFAVERTGDALFDRVATVQDR